MAWLSLYMRSHAGAWEREGGDMRLFLLLPCLTSSRIDTEVSLAFFGGFEFFGVGVATFFAGVFRLGGLRFFGLRFHGREEKHIADGVVVGEHHHEAVDADPLSGGGGHAVAQSPDEVGVHVHRFVVSGDLFGLDLCLEALVLVEGVIELVEAVGEFFSGHEELEALGDLRVFVAAARQRRDVDGVVDDEGGVDQLLFNKSIKQLSLNVAQCEVGISLDAVLFEVGQPFFTISSDISRNAADGGQRLDEGDFGKGNRAVDLQVAVGDRPPHVEAVEQVNEERFSQCHQIVVIVPCPVELD